MINLDGVADKSDALVSLRPDAQWQCVVMSLSG